MKHFFSIQLKQSLPIGVLAMAMLLGACSNNETPTQKTEHNNPHDEVATIKIATESSFKPFSYTDAQGNLLGFEIDLAHALCEQMQVKCDISSQDWDGLIPGLKAKKFDAIMAGMSITPEREQVIQFSDPYFNNSLILVAKKGSNISLENLSNKSIGVQRATVAAQYLAEHYPDTTIKLYDTQDNAYLDLNSGRVDALLSDKVPASDWLKTDAGKDFEVKGNEIDTNDKIAIAFRQKDPLVNQFNKALVELKNNGKYNQIVNHYFVDTP